MKALEGETNPDTRAVYEWLADVHWLAASPAPKRQVTGIGRTEQEASASSSAPSSSTR